MDRRTYRAWPSTNAQDKAYHVIVQDHGIIIPELNSLSITWNRLVSIKHDNTVANKKSSSTSSSNWLNRMLFSSNSSSEKPTQPINLSSSLVLVYDVHLEAGSTWTCAICKAQNFAEHIACHLCGIKQKSNTANASWHCKKCTFGNKPADQLCQMCENPRFPQDTLTLYMPTDAAVAAFQHISNLKDQAKTAPSNTVCGISSLQTQQTHQMNKRQDTLSLAFQDLASLRRSAQALMDLSAQIVSDHHNQEDDAQCQLNKLLFDVGLADAAVTDNNDSSFIQSLSQQLDLFLKRLFAINTKTLSSKSTQTGAGKKSASQIHWKVVSLPSLYCLYNRARGSAPLISPNDLQSAVMLLSSHQWTLFIFSMDSKQEHVSMCSSQSLLESMSLLSVSDSSCISATDPSLSNSTHIGDQIDQRQLKSLSSSFMVLAPAHYDPLDDLNFDQGAGIDAIVLFESQKGQLGSIVIAEAFLQRGTLDGRLCIDHRPDGTTQFFPNLILNDDNPPL